MFGEERLRELAAAIMRYLSERPHAVDTAEGIENWWIGSAALPGEVQAALDLLVLRGDMRAVRIGNRLLYRAAK